MHKPSGGFVHLANGNASRMIGNYQEEWRAAIEQAISEFGCNVWIASPSNEHYAFCLWAGRANNLGEFHARVRELMEEERQDETS